VCRPHQLLLQPPAALSSPYSPPATRQLFTAPPRSSLDFNTSFHPTLLHSLYHIHCLSINTVPTQIVCLRPIFCALPHAKFVITARTPSVSLSRHYNLFFLRQSPPPTTSFAPVPQKILFPISFCGIDLSSLYIKLREREAVSPLCRLLHKVRRSALSFVPPRIVARFLPLHASVF